MRFSFTRPEGEAFGAGRPLVDVAIDDLEQPLRCLIDTGSLRTRLPAWPAELLGIDLGVAPTETISVGGLRTIARQSHVTLTLGGIVVPSAVWFCDPWDGPFGLIGQEDVLRAFRLVYSAGAEWFELTEEASGGRLR